MKIHIIEDWDCTCYSFEKPNPEYLSQKWKEYNPDNFKQYNNDIIDISWFKYLFLKILDWIDSKRFNILVDLSIKCDEKKVKE